MNEYTLPNLTHNAIEDAYDEIELLGFVVSMSDFEMLDTSQLPAIESQVPMPKAKDLPKYLHQTVCMLGNYVTSKSVKTTRGDYMAFGTFYDTDSAFFDTTHFPPALQQYPFEGRGIYRITGRVVEEFGFYTIEVDSMKKLPTKPDPRY